MEALAGFLLHYANTYKPHREKEFYELKTAIIKRYGKYICSDVQHIRKECYGCYGTGTFRGYDNGFEWIECTPKRCYKCNGTGIYEQSYSLLWLFQVGDYYFHQPIKHSRTPLQPTEEGKIIKGYIRHKHPKYYFYYEALFWLCLLYKPSYLKYFFGRWGMPGPKRSPLVWLANIYFQARCFNLKNYIEKLKMRRKQKLRFPFTYYREDVLDDLPF